MKKLIHSNKGIALVSALIILSIFIVIVYIVMAVFTSRVSLFKQFREWQLAYYAAESGAEQCLYIEQKTSLGGFPQPLGPVIFTNGAAYSMSPACGVNGQKRVTGTYKTSSTVIEIERYTGVPGF